MNYCAFEKAFSDTFDFWNQISDSDKKIICENTRLVSFQKGSTVHDGNSCSGVFVINSGSLRVYVLSDEGKEITLYRLHKGEMCMLSASCVLQAITFDVVIDAEEDCECMVINGDIFSQLSDKIPEIKIFALETAVGRFSDVMWVLQQILFMSMDKRLAIFLWDESIRLGTDNIELTHEQIAKYIGSAREVVSRVLKYFSNEGIVENSRKGVKILDKKRLRDLGWR